MLIITRQSKARDAAAAWRNQYGPERCGHWYLYINGRGDSEATYRMLAALGSIPDPDAVDAIIGNTSWTQPPRCDQCGRHDNTPRIQVGADPDYESNTVFLCADCVEHAAKEMREFLDNAESTR